MRDLIIEPTAAAHWYTLVNEAEYACGNYLAEEIESYLVWLLLRFTNQSDLLFKSLGMEYLQSHHMLGTPQQEHLRDVGDICLLLAGLFPERAIKLLVPVTYFIELGRNAYGDLALLLHSLRSQKSRAELYSELRQKFMELTETLQCIRELADENALSLIQAEELWQYANSEHALKIIRKYTKGVLVYSELKDKKLH